MAGFRGLMAAVLVCMYVSVSSTGTCKCTMQNGVQHIDCSRQNLTYIPMVKCFNIPIKTHLDFSRNLLSLDNNTIFTNIKAKLVFIDLAHNMISSISDDAFQDLKHLINITLAGNKLEKFPFQAIASIPSRIIYHLDLGSNSISSLDPPANFSCSARRLDLDNNKFDAFPNFCKDDSRSYFPELLRLNFQFNFMRAIESNNYRCLHKLRTFHLNGNIVRTLYTNMFANLASIEKITLSETVGLAYIHRAPFNNSNLKQLYFRKNSLYTENSKHTLNMLEGCTSLKLLNMANNRFDKTTDKQFEALLGPVKKTLTILIMGGCGLNKIPDMFLRLEVLEELVLYENRIGLWPDGGLNNLTNLNTLYMAQNEITTLTESSFPRSFRNNSLHVDISRNPYHCTCDLRWFIEWMKSEPEKFNITDMITSIYTYTCTTPASDEGKRLINIPLSDSYCALDQNSKIITLVFSTTIIIMLVAVSIGYRFRWHIRYCIYIIRYKQRKLVDTTNYTYDVFVTYSVEDRQWVMKTLMPVLENQANLKLCVHDRDFEVGKLIVDNIVDSVESSRCLLIILSNTFAQSPWCQFELNLIQRYVLEHEQHVLVVVMLEDIETRYVTKSMHVLLDTMTYLLWGEDGFAKKAFFNRLRLLLRRNDRMSSRRISV